MRPPRLWRPQPRQRRALPAVRAAKPDLAAESAARERCAECAPDDRAPHLAARLLFSVEPTDRALTEWRPPQRGALE